jgi:hypothetical protein
MGVGPAGRGFEIPSLTLRKAPLRGIPACRAIEPLGAQTARNVSMGALRASHPHRRKGGPFTERLPARSKLTLDEPHKAALEWRKGSMSRKTLKTITTLAAVLATAAVVPE